jgi:hypothetical protein
MRRLDIIVVTPAAMLSEAGLVDRPQYRDRI